MDIRIKIGIVERGGRREERGEPLSQQPPEGVSSSGPAVVVTLCSIRNQFEAQMTVGTREADDVISL